MEKHYFEDEAFDRLDASTRPLVPGDYEGCRFTACNFTRADLSNFRFSECSFTGCNFSLVKSVQTAWTDCRFTDCKLLGFPFFQSNPFLFSVRFEQCMLQLANFYQLGLKRTLFLRCQLHEADFTGADLQAAIFDQCDLLGARFDQSNLEKADFRTAFNYTIDPAMNRVKKARFSAEGLAGLLERFDLDIS
jgi:fluoroquinolone resistance protein